MAKHYNRAVPTDRYQNMCFVEGMANPEQKSQGKGLPPENDSMLECPNNLVPVSCV
jgi:hypothetical protein